VSPGRRGLASSLVPHAAESVAGCTPRDAPGVLAQLSMQPQHREPMRALWPCAMHFMPPSSASVTWVAMFLCRNVGASAPGGTSSTALIRSAMVMPAVAAAVAMADLINAVDLVPPGADALTFRYKNTATPCNARRRWQHGVHGAWQERAHRLW